MSGRSSNASLQEEVAAAVAAAPDGTARGVIVRQFLDRGVSRASLYAWIERAMTGVAMNRAKGTHSPPIETDKRLMRALSVKQTGRPIEFQAVLQELLADTMMLRAMAMSDDGKVKNPRLLLEAVDKAGRTLDRAARIGAIIQSLESDRAFMRDLAAVIHRLHPSIRDPILAEMRALGHGGMV